MSLLHAARVLAGARIIASKHLELHTKQIRQLAQTSSALRPLCEHGARATAAAGAAGTLLRRLLLEHDSAETQRDNVDVAAEVERARRRQSRSGAQPPPPPSPSQPVPTRSGHLGPAGEPGKEVSRQPEDGIRLAKEDAGDQAETAAKEDHFRLADRLEAPDGPAHKTKSQPAGPNDTTEPSDEPTIPTVREDVESKINARDNDECLPHSSKEVAPETPTITPDSTQSSPSAPISSDLPQNQFSQPVRDYKMRESAVPSSQFGRIFQYGALFGGMAVGAVSEQMKRAVGAGAEAGTSLLLSPANVERLVSRLSRMRGAALKIGQMLSIQDLKLIPTAFHDVLRRVQDSADYMPPRQRDRVLKANLGPEWSVIFSEFDELPMAAASIGQVHKAVIKSTETPVAVKIQYPGVSASIDSDLDNLSLLLTASRLLPKGMFLNKTIDNARTELAWECDYTREAACANRFRELLKDDPDFAVPQIFPEASGVHVLTAEMMDGVSVTRIPAEELTQADRDWVGTQILRLCFREIMEFRFMQTDPNWTNFLFSRGGGGGGGGGGSRSRTIQLIDFGASRAYSSAFTDTYVALLRAAADQDADAVADLSVQLGYLTGDESAQMRDAHIQSVMVLAEPFSPGHYAAAADGQQQEQQQQHPIYDFSNQTLTDRIRAQVGTMLAHRLVPPPEETYSIHRKLSGAFLLCARLGARVECKRIFEEAVAEFERARLDTAENRARKARQAEMWRQMGDWEGWDIE